MNDETCRCTDIRTADQAEMLRLLVAQQRLAEAFIEFGAAVSDDFKLLSSIPAERKQQHFSVRLREQRSRW